MDLISVIVPVYKVEPYLEKCIASIAKQTYKNLEIILVDDGSMDRCPLICDEWANKDSRIKVLHKKNGGLSDARNAGLRIAKGDYIAFVDSDDWIDCDLYNMLMLTLKKSNSDIACCRILKVWEDGDKSSPDVFSGGYKVYNTEGAMAELITDGDIQQVVWNKLYRRTILENILFEKGKCNEDEFWSYQVIGHSNQTVVVDYAGYYYLQRQGSIMGSTYSIKRLDAVQAKVNRQEYLLTSFPSLVTLGKKNLLYTCLYHGQLALRYITGTEKDDALKWLKNIYKQYSFGYEELRQISFKDRLWFELGKLNFSFACNLRNLLKIGY